jgi:hypothetical protein
VQKQEGTPISERFRHAWVDELRNGMHSFKKETENDGIRKAIKKYYRDKEASGNNRVLIIDGDERVSGFSVYCFRHIGFTEEDPGFFYVLEDRKKWKPVLNFRNIRSVIQEHRFKYNPFIHRSAQYIAKGEKVRLPPAGIMKRHLKSQIRQQRKYIEREAPSDGADLAREYLARLQFRALGWGNQALEETMESHWYKSDEGIEKELKKVTEAYYMSDFLYTRNVQRKLEREREHRAFAREERRRNQCYD